MMKSSIDFASVMCPAVFDMAGMDQTEAGIVMGQVAHGR
jgi:hypothetical protein